MFNGKTQSLSSQTKVLMEGGDLGETEVDVSLSVRHSCVWPLRWTLYYKHLNSNRVYAYANGIKFKLGVLTDLTQE